jgi:WD40 repeat protein
MEWVLWVGFSPDGETVAARGVSKDSNARLVRLWNTATGRLLATLSTGADAVAFSPDGKTVATTGGNDGTRLWTLTGERTGRDIHQGREGVAFGPDGSLFTSEPLGVYRTDLKTGAATQLLNVVRSSFVAPLALNPQDKFLAVADGKEVRVLDPAKQSVEYTFAEHGDQITDLMFDKAGKILATVSYDGTARIWDYATRKEHARLDCGGGWAEAAALVPDGTAVALACDGSIDVHLYDVDGRPLSTLRGHTDTIYGVAFSPRGDTLASASGDGTIRLWRYPRSAG